MMILPSRKEYLQNHARNNQRIMGILPALYPREILWGFGILPLEIWDPPGEILQANAHLQATICPVVKRSLEFILKDVTIINSGYLFPHTCDSIQNLATQVQDLIGISAPVYTFYNPKGEFSNATRTYYQSQLVAFQKILETTYGALSQEKLIAACELSFKIDQRRIELQEARLSGRLTLNNLHYFQTIRAGEYLKPEDFLSLLEQVQILDQPANQDTYRLLLSGILPPNNAVLSFLDELNVILVSEDLLSGSRRVPMVSSNQPKDPLEYLTDRHFLLPPCSTRAGSLEKRIQYLNGILTQGQIQGVLFSIVKFCEPELFDHRYLSKSLKNSGIPSLTLETELESGLSGQEKTRLEAFTEILAAGGQN